jgi:hypothetical protein
MEGSVLSLLKAEWKASDTGSAHWAYSFTYLPADQVGQCKDCSIRTIVAKHFAHLNEKKIISCCFWLIELFISHMFIF